MEKTIIVTFAVVPATHAPHFFATCRKCGKTLSEGAWAIGLGIKDQCFFVGASPRIICCKVEARVPFFFSSKQEAKEKREEIMEQVEREDGKLVSFNFFSAEGFMKERVH